MAVRKTKKGASLKRWFKEEWKDVRTGKPCGRRKGEKRGTPYCRPSKRVSSKTPKTSGEMTAAEKRSRISQKKRLGQPAGKPRRVKSLRRRKKVMSHCKPRKAMGGAMSMPTRNSKGPSALVSKTVVVIFLTLMVAVTLL